MTHPLTLHCLTDWSTNKLIVYWPFFFVSLFLCFFLSLILSFLLGMDIDQFLDSEGVVRVEGKDADSPSSSPRFQRWVSHWNSDWLVDCCWFGEGLREGGWMSEGEREGWLIDWLIDWLILFLLVGCISYHCPFLILLIYPLLSFLHRQNHNNNNNNNNSSGSGCYKMTTSEGQGLGHK